MDKEVTNTVDAAKIMHEVQFALLECQRQGVRNVVMTSLLHSPIPNHLSTKM